MRNFSIEEGEAFLVPTSEGDAVGVVSRVGQGNVMVAYFFPPGSLGEGVDQARLNPADAVKVMRIGPLGFTRENWPRLGRLAGWQREKWNALMFKGKAAGMPGYTGYLYQDRDVSELEKRIPLTDEEAGPLPENGLYGHLLVPKVLAKLF